MMPTTTFLVLGRTAHSTVTASPAVAHSLCIGHLASRAACIRVVLDALVAVVFLTVVYDCHEIIVLLDPQDFLGSYERTQAVTRAEVAAGKASNVEIAHCNVR